LNVPWDYPGLSNKSTTTSPFTIVFQEMGYSVAASTMNSVILTSVLSAGNHALFTGTRILYSLAATTPAQAPRIFAWTTARGVPVPALLATSSVGALCFWSSFIGSGELWAWLQNIVGVSNQIAWLSIGLVSWRFRKAWVLQGRPLTELKFQAAWTWGWGPPFVIVTVTALLLIQGWSSVIPRFSALDFLSFYVEIPVMILMTIVWMFLSHLPPLVQLPPTPPVPAARPQRWWGGDLVDVGSVDLNRDEYREEVEEEDGREEREGKGVAGLLWRVYYWVA